MTCKVERRSHFEREFKRLNQELKERIESKIEEIAKYPQIGERLKGKLSHLRKVRIGKYRLIYEFKPCNVILTSIIPRDWEYRRL